jgi:hypothetical protein
MPTPRVPMASWCPVCDSKDIAAAPLDLGATVEQAPATVRPWSCRACGALWLMALPLKVTNAPPATANPRPSSSWRIVGGSIVPMHSANGGGRIIRGRR